MKRRIAVLSLSLLSIVCLASCEKEVTYKEALAQIREYDTDAVYEKYSGCTITTETTSSTDYVDGEDTSDSMIQETEAEVSVISVSDLISLEDSFATEDYYFTYYLDGSALRITCDYNAASSSMGYTVSVSIYYELATYDDGRYKSCYMDYVYDIESYGTQKTIVEMTFAYTKA